MEEWEREVHASDSSVHESGYRWKDPSTWSWHAHELSDQEIFARLTRTDSGDESESEYEPYCAPKPLDFDYVSYGAYKPADDGWHAPAGSTPVPPGLPSTPQSSWQPHSSAWVFREHVFNKSDELAAGMPVVIEPLDVPAPSEPTIPQLIHPVQYGITPTRLHLPHSDDEILSLVSTKMSRPHEMDLQLGRYPDPSTTLERHLASKGSAKPIYRDACDRRHFFHQPIYCFDNNVPNRLLKQTRPSILSCNPGPRRRKAPAH